MTASDVPVAAPAPAPLPVAIGDHVIYVESGGDDRSPNRRLPAIVLYVGDPRPEAKPDSVPEDLVGPVVDLVYASPHDGDDAGNARGMMRARNVPFVADETVMPESFTIAQANGHARHYFVKA